MPHQFIFYHHQAKRSVGAALLLAMIVLTLISTLAGAMVWQQWQSIYAESAERDRSQTNWLLNGALDWAGFVLRSDNPSVDHLAEPWAVSLPEVRLSSFLSLDSQNNSSDVVDDDLAQTFLSASIVDAQSRYNLRNLVDKDNELDLTQVDVLKRIFNAAKLPPEKAQLFAQACYSALLLEQKDDTARMMPDRLTRLNWLDIPTDAIDQLKEWLVILPEPTPLNINTTHPKILAAVFPQLGIVKANQLSSRVKNQPFSQIEQLANDFSELLLKNYDSKLQPYQLTWPMVGVSTNYFEVTMKLRLEAREINRTSLIKRPNPSQGTKNTVVLYHEINTTHKP